MDETTEGNDTYPSSEFWQAFARPTAQALGVRQLKHIDYMLTARLRRIVGNFEAQLDGQEPIREIAEVQDPPFCPMELEEVAMAGLGLGARQIGVPDFALDMEELGQLRAVLGDFRRKALEQHQYHTPAIQGQGKLGLG